MSGNAASARIAVIDDDVSFREALAGLIRSLGHAADTYESAADFMARPEQRYDLMFIDMQMPGMSGLDLLAWLGASGRKAPVVMISSRADEPTKSDALRLGARDFLKKPFSAGRLTALLEQIA